MEAKLEQASKVIAEQECTIQESNKRIRSPIVDLVATKKIKVTSRTWGDCHGMGRVYRANSQRWPDRPEDGYQAAQIAAVESGRRRRPGSQVAERSADKECTICKSRKRREMKIKELRNNQFDT